METKVQVSDKASSKLKNAFKYGSKATLFLLIFMVASVCAQTTDYSTMTSGLESEISGAKIVLMVLGGSVLGVGVLFVVYRFFKRMLG